MQDAHDRSVKLDKLYFMGCILILCVGLRLCLSALHAFCVHHKRLNTVIKSYAWVLIPDLVMCVNFLLRDIANLGHGRLLRGPWCKLSAFVAMTSVTALHGSSVCLSYGTLRMVQGSPLALRLVTRYNGLAWAVAIVMTAAFPLPHLGPYKGLYCCITEEGHVPLSVVPFVVFFLACCLLMARFYIQAFAQLQAKEASLYLDQDGAIKTSTRLFYNSLTLLSVTYGCWAVIVVVSLATMNGHSVNPAWDVVGAWLAKLQPIIDSSILLRMIGRAVTAKPKRGSGGPNKREASGGSDSEARLASGRRVSSVQVVPLDVALFGDEPLAVHSPKPARMPQADALGAPVPPPVPPPSSPSSSSSPSGYRPPPPVPPTLAIEQALTITLRSGQLPGKAAELSRFSEMMMRTHRGPTDG